MVRLAFTGTHGVGKDKLVYECVEPLWGEMGFDWVTLNSSQRYVAELTGLPTDGSSDWLNLWSAVDRRLSIARYYSMDCLLSPRTGLDNAAYQMRLSFNRQMEFNKEAPTKGIIAPDGKTIQLGPEMAEKYALVGRSQAALQLLIEMAADEIDQCWDFVYWMRPLDSVLLEDDGVRPDKQAQIEVDMYLERLIRGAPGLPVLTAFEKIVELPRDLDEAKSFLESESERWREYASAAGH